LKEQSLDLQVFSFAAMFVKLCQERLLLPLGELIEAIKVTSVTTNLKEQTERLDSELPNRYNESFVLPGRHRWRLTMR
jgi:Lhr-like helicase